MPCRQTLSPGLDALKCHNSLPPLFSVVVFVSGSSFRGRGHWDAVPGAPRPAPLRVLAVWQLGGAVDRVDQEIVDVSHICLTDENSSFVIKGQTLSEPQAEKETRPFVRSSILFSSGVRSAMLHRNFGGGADKNPGSTNKYTKFVQLIIRKIIKVIATRSHILIRLRNDLYCVGWGVKLYSLTHLTF